MECFRLFLTLLAFTLLTSCSNLLYYPDRRLYVDPEKLDPKPVAVEFKDETGHNLFGWYFATPKKPARAVIVLFHGNAQNLSSHFIGLYWLIKEGYDLFVFDYRGYGKVAGEPTPENTVWAGKAALREVRKREPQLPLVIYGQSLGGAIALRTAIEMQNEIKASLIVADSTFLSYKRVARRALAQNWFTWILQPLGYLVLSDEWAPGERVAELSPLLIMHSRIDRVVPFANGEEINSLARGDKEFWILEKTDHIQTFEPPHGLEVRKRFLEKLKSLKM